MSVSVPSARPQRSGRTGPAGIDRPDAVTRILAGVNTAATAITQVHQVRRAVHRARRLRTDRDDPTRVLPVAPEIADLLPWPGGLRRGTTVAALGGTSLLLTLLGGAMRAGNAWAATVGAPDLGALAAAGYA